MKKLLCLIYISFFFISNGIGQESNFKMDSSAFDFWIGTWKVSWMHKDSTLGTGENHVYKILNDHVIYENFEVFEDPSMKGFTGKSFSVYNKFSGEWKQTWVDNSGGYLDFVGEMQDEKKIFKRIFTGRNGDTIMQRMVFYDIRQDSFTWNWEISRDRGENWHLQWKIQYKRKSD